MHVSIGTAGVLGLADVPMAVPPTTAYLMLGGRCSMSCAFCAQARQSLASDLALSRVTWPEFSLDEVCAELPAAERRGDLHRCCIQVTAGKDSFHRALDAVTRIRRSTSLPVDVAILPANMQQVAALVDAGVDHIGFGLDAASERVFRLIKGSHWGRMLSVIAGTALRFPGRAAIHLIVGLGETEREMASRLVWARDAGIGAGLFAFTPVRGTPLADRPPPPLGQYRRMQAARWLVMQHGARLLDFVFGVASDSAGPPDAAETCTDIALRDWAGLLTCGEAFRTSGCSGCNRPFYNERPGGTLYNYARPLGSAEAQLAVAEMGINGTGNHS